MAKDAKPSNTQRHSTLAEIRFQERSRQATKGKRRKPTIGQATDHIGVIRRQPIAISQPVTQRRPAAVHNGTSQRFFAAKAGDAASPSNMPTANKATEDGKTSPIVDVRHHFGRIGSPIRTGTHHRHCHGNLLSTPVRPRANLQVPITRSVCLTQPRAKLPMRPRCVPADSDSRSVTARTDTFQQPLQIGPPKGAFRDVGPIWDVPLGDDGPKTPGSAKGGQFSCRACVVRNNSPRSCICAMLKS